MRIGPETTLLELAAVVSEALRAAGIVATLSGGSAVTIYSENRYESTDLDFVTAANLEMLKAALTPLGFLHSGTPRLLVFEHPDTQWYLEFPPAPLSFGGTYVDVSECRRLQTPAGELSIITPTHCVMDRLMAAAAWHDAPSLEQATLVATRQATQIDWNEIDAWTLREGITDSRQVRSFYRSLGRELPST